MSPLPIFKARRAVVKPITITPPSSGFGLSLPTRISPSTGTQYYVSTTGNNNNNGSIGSPWNTLQYALDNVPLNGSIINLRGGTYTLSSQLNWTRAGNSGNPVTLQNYPGETVIVSQQRFLITGSYLRIKGEVTATGSRLTFANGLEEIRISGGGNHIDIDGIWIHSKGNQGFLLGSGGYNGSAADATYIQIWNTRISNIGYQNVPTDNHGIYFDNCDNVVVANCLIYGNEQYGLQIYPKCSNTIITCCTIDDHSAAAPIVMEGAGSGTVTNVRVAACSLSVSDIGSGFSALMARWAGSGNQVHDCLGYQVLTPAFQHVVTGTVTNCNSASVNPLYVDKPNRDYNLQAGSPLINLAASRTEWIPATDMLGNSRVTADAGAYAKTPVVITFGNFLPSRIPESTGSVINVSTFAQLQTALATCAFGSIIDLGGNTIDLTYSLRNTILYWNRNPPAPYNVTTIQNGILTGMYLGVLNGSYFRFRNIESRNAVGIGASYSAGFGFRCEGLGTRSHHIEWDNCYVNNAALSGWMIQDKSDYWQIWNSTAHSCGQQGTSGHSHAMYLESHSGNCVVANCVLSDWGGFGLHVSTDALSANALTNGLICTGITSINGDNPNGSALITYSAQGDVTQTNCIFVGIVAKNAPSGIAASWESLGANNRIYGGLQYQGTLLASASDFAPIYYNGSVNVSGIKIGDPLFDINFRPSSSSAVKNIVPASMYGYLPALDKDNLPRLTADAGCFRCP